MAEKRPKPFAVPDIEDEPGMAERFQRGLQRALTTPPKHRGEPTRKPKERPASKGRAYKKETSS